MKKESMMLSFLFTQMPFGFKLQSSLIHQLIAALHEGSKGFAFQQSFWKHR